MQRLTARVLGLSLILTIGTNVNAGLPFNSVDEFLSTADRNSFTTVEVAQIVVPKIEVPKVDPNINPRVNPKVDPNINPKVNPRVNPELNPRVNPKIDPEINPRVEPKVRPDVNPNINPKIKIDPGVGTAGVRNATAVTQIELPKVDPKVPNVDPKIDPKVDPKVDPRVDPKINPEVDPKIDPKVDPKVDPRVDPKVNPKVDPKIDPRVNPEINPKVEPKIDPNIDPKIDPKVDPKVEPKVTPKIDTPLSNLEGGAVAQIIEFPKIEVPQVPNVSPRVSPRVNPAVDPRVNPTINPKVEPKVYPHVKPEIDTRINPVVRPGISPRVGLNTSASSSLVAQIELPKVDVPKIRRPNVQRPAQRQIPRERPNVNRQIEPNLRPKVNPNVRPQIKPEVKPNVRPEVKPELNPNVRPEINPKLNPKIRPQVNPELNPKIDPKVNPKVDPKIRPEVKPELNPKVDPKVRPEIDPKIDPKVNPELNPKVDPKIDPKLRPGINPEVNPDIKPGVKPDIDGKVNPKVDAGVKARTRPGRDGLPGLDADADIDSKARTRPGRDGLPGVDADADIDAKARTNRRRTDIGADVDANVDADGRNLPTIELAPINIRGEGRRGEGRQNLPGINRGEIDADAKVDANVGADVEIENPAKLSIEQRRESLRERMRFDRDGRDGRDGRDRDGRDRDGDRRGDRDFYRRHGSYWPAWYALNFGVHHDWYHGHRFAQRWSPRPRYAFWWNRYPVLTSFGVTDYTLAYTGYAFGYRPYYNPFFTPGPDVIYSYDRPIVYYTGTSQSAPLPESQAGLREFADARNHFMNQDYEDALASVDAALEQRPRDIEIHQFLSLTQFALGNYEAAAAAQYAVLSVSPSWNWETLKGLYPSVDVFTGQLRQLEDYRIKYPDHVASRFLLGNFYNVMGYPEDAAAELAVVAKARPDDQVVANLLSQLDPNYEASASAEVQAPPQVDAEVNADMLIGNWNATRDDGSKFGLTLKEDGNFTWAYSHEDVKSNVQGAYVLKEDGVLALEMQDGAVMFAQIVPKDQGFEFHMIGDTTGQAPLTFTSVGG